MARKKKLERNTRIVAERLKGGFWLVCPLQSPFALPYTFPLSLNIVPEFLTFGFKKDSNILNCFPFTLKTSLYSFTILRS